MRISRERIITTHVGSLPRSVELSAVLLQKDRGETYDPAAYERLACEAVERAIRRQVAAGVDVPSDGEQSKVGYATYMLDRLEGFSEGHVPRKPPLDLKDHPEFVRKMAAVMGTQGFRRAACVGPVRLTGLQPLRQDIDNLLAAAGRAGVDEAFMNSASPGLITAFLPNQYYPSHEAYVEALAAAMRPEYEAIVQAGLILQLDCPDLAMARHTGFQDLTEAEFVARAALHVEAMNAALANVPADRARLHICWGNYEGPHDHDIPLERVLDVVLTAKPAGVLFEGANARHEHEWAVWRDAAIPEEKVLIPGLIDSCSNYVEHPELVAQRIERYAAIVGRERVIAGTDCGFGTFAGYGKVDEDIVWKKLAALAEGAAIASGRLWSSKRRPETPAIPVAP
jgi:5-methyltetrahydropteroyltriglutamate--homocysteine methyltransferase